MVEGRKVEKLEVWEEVVLTFLTSITIIALLVSY